MMQDAGFSIGSNLGDRLANLQEAARRLVERSGGRLAARSPVYETEPVGVKPAYRDMKYLNAVLILESPRQAGQWLHVITDVERAMGRQRTEDRNAPRAIDIDLLFCGRQCLEGNLIVVPHPRWQERRFVLQPLADVRPAMVLPGAEQTVSEVLAGLPPGGAVERFAGDW